MNAKVYHQTLAEAEAEHEAEHIVMDLDAERAALREEYCGDCGEPIDTPGQHCLVSDSTCFPE